MRGPDEGTRPLFGYLSPEQRVRPDPPLRSIRAVTDRVLTELSPRVERMYSEIGRPSIPPEQLLRALVLQTRYSVRSERLLMEEINDSILFRGFVGLGLDEPIWSPPTFSKNRDRAAFFEAIVGQARAAGLLSDEHFTVDGTQLEAGASLKGFRRRGERPTEPPDDPGNPTVNSHGERRSNATPASTTDPDAQLARKSYGEKAVLAYLGHLLLDNRHGLVVHACATAATGTAEILLQTSARRGTVGAHKNYDVASFVRACGLTPHVARRVRFTAIDDRTTRPPAYPISQRKRNLVEQVFGWMKPLGLLRTLRHRGGELVDCIVTFTAAAHNLVRWPTLLAET